MSPPSAACTASSADMVPGLRRAVGVFLQDVITDIGQRAKLADGAGKLPCPTLFAGPWLKASRRLPRLRPQSSERKLIQQARIAGAL